MGVRAKFNKLLFSTVLVGTLVLMLTGCGSSSKSAPKGGTGTENLPMSSTEKTSLFGIRNFSEISQVKAWSDSDLTTEFADHNLGYGALWIFWKLLEPQKDVFEFTELDYGLDRMRLLNLTPVVVVHLDAPWAMKSSADGGSFTGPYDLEVGETPVWPPPGKGYSNEVYDMATKVANHIAKRFSGEVFVRFHNEAWTEWPLGTPTPANGISNEMQGNLNNYLLSFFTLKLAFEEVAKKYPDLDFLYGHGSLPRGHILYREWLKQGQEDPSLRPKLLNKFISVTERNTPVVSWEDVVARFSYATSLNITFDAWVDQLIDWTKLGYFDFMTRHSHEKYRFVNDERDLIENALGANVAANIKWINAETAFEMLDPASWPPQLNGTNLNQFVAETLTRKWTTLASRGEAFMTPVLGVPYPKYIGLFEPDGKGGLSPLPVNDAFVRMSQLIGAFESVEVLREDNAAVYRFYSSDNAAVTDVVWHRTLNDNDNSTISVTVAAPKGFQTVQVEDAFGALVSAKTDAQSLVIDDLSQQPRILIWSP